jgi:hypothetical protein
MKTVGSSQYHSQMTRINLEFPNLISTIVLGVIVLLFGEGILLPRPDIRYVKVGPLKSVDGFSQGILLINRGGRPAINVDVYIAYENAIIDEQVLYNESVFLHNPEIVRDENGHYITLRFDRLSEKEEGLIYLNVFGENQEPEVIVRHDDGSGKEGVYERSLWDTIIIVLGFVSFWWLILSNIGRLGILNKARGWL